MVNLQKGLVGHWTFDAGATNNSTAYDSSAYDNHGSISGATIDSNSAIGDSLKFTNDSHEVDLSSVPIIAVEKSISFWLRSNRSLDTDDEWEVGFLDGPSNQGTMFGMMFGVGGTQDLGYWGFGNTYDVNIGSQSNKWASNDNWRHIVLTMDSNNDVRIYIDGQQATNLVANDGTDYGSVITGLSNTESGFKLNSIKNWSDHTNRISDLRIYNRALSKSEINALYNMRSQRRKNVIYPTVENIRKGCESTTFSFVANQWNGSSNAGEIDIVNGTTFERVNGGTKDISPINNGVALEDSGNGDGYLMYSRENVHNRFTNPSPNSRNCNHVIGVVYDGEWYYDDNQGASNPFTPRNTDVLIAEFTYAIDSVNGLTGFTR